MTPHDRVQASGKPDPTGHASTSPVLLRSGLTGILVLLVGAGLSYYWITHKPRSARHKSRPSSPLVKVMAVGRSTFFSRIRTMGTVIPARRVELAPRVGGQVIRISPNLVPGGRFARGRIVAWIDPEDYRLALQQREAELAKRKADLAQARALVLQHQAGITQARSDLKLEMGRQKVARDDFRLLGSRAATGDKDFILRKPQLAAAKARLESHQALLRSSRAAVQSAEAAINMARAAVDQARLNLQRTTIRAPFNCMVSARHIEQGSQAAVGKVVALLVGTDEYWVRATLPLSTLKWLGLSAGTGDARTKVRITHRAAWGENVFRTGEARQLEAEVEPGGRMARLIVAVRDPLSLKPENRGKPILLLGSFVHLTIAGRRIENVFTVPAGAVHEGSLIWVMRPDQTLDIRRVEIVWQDQDTVCIESGLREGEQVVVSDLATPIQGMRLRKSDSQPGDNGPGDRKPAETRLFKRNIGRS